MNINAQVIKISIAEIIISFQFDYQPFEAELIRIFSKFIVKTQKSDVDINLKMLEEYKSIDGKYDYLITDIKNNTATIKKWDINGELNIKTNKGVFEINNEFITFFPLVKFIFLNIFPQYNAFLLHSSTVINNEFGIVASGVSGAGKTTFAKKLEKENFIILHDEITLIRKINNSFNVFPNPFTQNKKHFVNFSSLKPLKYIFILEQNKEFFNKNISLKLFIKEMLKLILSYDKIKNENYNLILDFITDLYNEITVRKLSFDLNSKLSDKIL